MTTTERRYSDTGYRIIPDRDSYMMNAALEVWSVARIVPCKGGGTRQISAKRLKQDAGRVTLSQNGRLERLHVYRELFPITFPDLMKKQRREERQRPQVECKNGHPLCEFQHETLKRWMTPSPRVGEWGTGNRICLHCSHPPRRFVTDNLYSCAYGVGPTVDHTGLPAEPKLRKGRTFADLEWETRYYDDH